METSIKKNFDHKTKPCQQLLAKLSNKCKVFNVNLSLGAIGTIRKDSLIMTAMENFDLSKETLNFIVNRKSKQMHKNDLLHILHAQ